MARTSPPEEQRVYIREAAAYLKRRIGTLRGWEADGVLPEKLLPRRGKRNWRYWTQEQLDEIKTWIIETDRRPGKALEGLQERPPEQELEAHIAAMRKPHRPSFAPEVSRPKYSMETIYKLNKPISPDPLKARMQVGYDDMSAVEKRVFTRMHNSRFKKTNKDA